MDNKFVINTLRSTLLPNQLVWLAMHQDYSEDLVTDKLDRVPPEDKAGELIIKHLLKGGRGHWGVFEHPQITLACGYFPHSTMQQIRSHRVGISIDCQSFRYTGERIIAVAKNELDVEEVFYLRPIGKYTDRQGKYYEYTDKQRNQHLHACMHAALRYQTDINSGLSEEHARSLIPFDTRQHFVLSCNARSLMHLLDLRWKKDAQLEAQQFSELLFEEFKNWMPEVANWYFENRAKKARLSP